MYIFKSRSMIRFIIIIILLFLFIPNHFSFADSKRWDSNWSFSQEINIPFDTSLEIGHFQPIDIKVEFQNPCWAKNDLEHSIRVVCWDGKNWNELESQIYDLEHIKEDYIKSCNMVFLIPDFANGKEEYFVYYDDSEKNSPNYIDHLKIEESYYKYEPIPGYPLESSYYKILDDNYIPYAIAYKGQIMGYTTCQHITKMKEETVEMLPKNGDLFAAFDFRYSYGKGVFSYSSTSQKLISKKILVDGNLMLELRIVSTSKLDDLQTTATYKYYHCPTPNTRIHVHVKHESLKEINVYPHPPATNCDGVFTTLQCGGIKSKSIEELNIGEILPFMHFFNEIETTSEYILDIDPEYKPGEDPDNRVISIYDDVDLGKNAWISFDDGKTGISHSVIFSSNNIMTSGTNENDGLQLNAFEMDFPHLPGLENNIAAIQVGRNSFEGGKNHDLIIPEDFTVEFDAEFFSSKTEGFPIIEKEVEIFKELVKIKPQSKSKFDDDYDETEKYDISVFVHLAPSIPMGSTLSALLGFNLSYISIELYRNDEFISSGAAVRLPMKAIEELEDPNILEKIIATLKIFDIRNISIFKKAVFPDMEKGKYVIKIFKENAVFSKEKRYIGYAIVDLQKDEKIHVFCNFESSIKVKIIDQNNKIVKNAEVVLQKNNMNIAKGLTNENGQVILKAPISNTAYDFKVFYNGCIIFQEPIKLGLIKKIIPSEKTVKIQLHNLNLKVEDTWGQTPEVELNPVLTIYQNNESIRMYSEKNEDDTYIFKNLASNIYQLSLTYKSFNLKQNIEISEDKELKLKFPAEYNVKLKIMDARGKPYKNLKIVINRNNKKLEIQSKTSETIVIIPPAEYQVGIYDNDELISQRYIKVYGEQKYDLITNHQPIYPTIVILTSCLLIIISFMLLYYLKKLKCFYIIVVLILAILSLYLPWWGINGSTDYLQTSTTLYLIPNTMITITSTENTIAGEPSYLPDEFLIVINLMIIFTIIGCILLITNNIFKNTSKKRLYQISKIFTYLLFVGSFLIFIIAINEITKVTTGSIIGTDYLEFGVPGENQIYSVLSNWGPGIGFYIYLSSIVILTIPTLIKILRKEDRMISKNNQKTSQNIQHPLFGISTKKWLQLLDKNGGVDIGFLKRGVFITLSSIFTTPARMLFNIKYGSKINNTRIKYPPVIIIGHWRTGTTYLHELLSQDPQFCYVTLWNTLLPDSFLILEPIKKFLSNFLPKKRPMDEIKVDIDGPYEEEAAIAIFSPWSFFHCLHFPRNAEEQYLKSIHFEDLTDQDKDQWKKDYLKFMKTVTYSNNGKRLLLKNPANTTRIKILLEIFPDANFIHIYRNPYKVYLSTIKMRNKVLEKLALQKASKEEIEKQVIKNYKRLMKSYFEQEKQIPKNKLVDVKYEDLVSDPIKQVKKIYSKLKLPGLKNALPEMQKYLEKQKDYKTNVYAIDKKIIQRVKNNWNFTIDRWGYKPPK